MNKIVRLLIATMILWSISAQVFSQSDEESLAKKVDSLFVIASSGELKYRDSVQPAIDSLAAIGAPAAPALIDKLTTPDARERLTIINILKQIGAPAVPHLRTALSSKENTIQLQRICWALGDIGHDASSACPELFSAIVNHDWQVREYALRALGLVMDSSALVQYHTEAIEALKTGFADEVSQPRKSTAWAVMKLKTPELIPELIAGLGDSYYGARLNSREALVALGEKSVKPLLQKIKNDTAIAGDLACEALGQIAIDSENPELVDTLLSMYKRAKPNRRAALARALGSCMSEFQSRWLTNLRLTESDPYVMQCIDSALVTVRQRTSRPDQ